MGRIQDLLAVIRNYPDNLVVRALDEMLPRWIPVDERLPEVDPETMLLVCVQCEDGGRSVDVARWRLDADGKPSWGDVCGSNQTIYGWSHMFVVAWMPLPEPPDCTTQPR